MVLQGDLRDNTMSDLNRKLNIRTQHTPAHSPEASGHRSHLGLRLHLLLLLLHLLLLLELLQLFPLFGLFL